MKKLIAFILVITSLSCFAFADEIDLSGMSIEELYELHSSIDSEIQSRLNCTVASDNIGVGMYIVGKDIKSGNYTFTLVDGDFFRYYVYADLDAREELESLDFGYITEIGSTSHASLEDGMVLAIDHGTASIETPAKASWAP